MNFQLIIIVFTLCLLPVFPVKNVYAGTVKSESTSLQRKIIPPRIELIDHRKYEARPDTSVLEENGYFYSYKGKPVELLRIKNRVTLSYKEDNLGKNPRFKQKKTFQSAVYRHFSMGRKALEIMTIDKKTVKNKNGLEAFTDIVTAIEKDSSVLFAAPVYYEPKSGEEIVFTDRIAVKVTNEKNTSLLETIASTIDAEYEQKLMPQVFIFKCNHISSSDALQRCMAIENVPGVIWAQPEMTAHNKKCFIPNDPLYDRQWHHNNTGVNGGVSGADMKVASAWDIQQMGDTNITIAILDDGIEVTHPDLSIKAGGWDFIGDDDDPSPSSESDNHGTSVAGVAAAIGNNGIGVAGVAAGAKILPIKMLDDYIDLSDMQIASAITWAYQHGADVINNSWGQQTSIPSIIIENAIIDASTLGRNGKGCPVFCSSGNDATSFTTCNFPFNSDSYCFIAIVYQKDAAGSAGDDNIIIDNVTLYGSDGYSVVFNETFSGTTLPAGWFTCGGNNGSYTPDASVPGWHNTNLAYQQGFGDQTSYCSGAISDNQWTELRMPYRIYKAGEKLVVNMRVSTEDGHDSMKIRYYSSDTSFYAEEGLYSGSTNYTVSAISFPAGLDSAIAVGASTDLDYRSDYSQYDVSGIGKTVDFVAPSGGGFHKIPTTDRTGTDGFDSTSDYNEQFNGTSSSAPAASGLAALILSKNPLLSRNKVLEVMRSSCDTIGGVTYVNGVHKEYGYGRLNARRALENLPPVITGQLPVAVLINGSVTLSTNDLVIFDTETPDGPFTLIVESGSNYSVSGTTITVHSGFVGTLSVPVKVNDGVFTSDAFTLLVSVRATNIAPVITGQSPLTMLEDRKLRIAATDLMISDLDDPSGPFITTIGTGSNYAVVGDTIFPVAGFNGTLTIPIRASDRITTSVPFNVIVTVMPVNDAPSFIVGTDITVKEDCGLYTYANWANGISAGPFNESGQSISFMVSATNSALFATLPLVSSNGALSFTPADDASGTSTVTVFLQDNGDTANGGNNKSTEQVFTINVLSVNDPPVFVAGQEISVLEDAGVQTKSGWATITPGASNETGQNIVLSISVSDTTLFSGKPSITNDGTLSFIPAANRYGSAMVTVTATDDGGTANGGLATTIAVPFSITITPVNDAPEFTPGLAQIFVDEDAGAQSFVNWATDISAGQGESTQKISFSVVNDNTSLFSFQPVIDATGRLTFTPAPDANGVTEVRVRLRDDGGTEHGGIDSSYVNTTFKIDIAAVNDAPSISVKGKNNMEPGTEAVITISATDADGEIPKISVEDLPLFATFATDTQNGTATITCHPIADTGTFQIIISAKDSTISSNTTFTLRVRTIPVGSILIRGVSSQAITRLYASAGWIGTPVLTGPGIISDVKEGTYLLTISDSGARIGYYYSVVTSGTIDTVTAVSHPNVPVMFTASDTIRTLSGPIKAGEPVSVVIDDADSDGKKDIVYTGTDGIVLLCKGNGISFADPVSIHSGHNGKNILRCVDWNEDGINDLLIADNDSIHLSFGSAGGLFQDDSALFAIDPGCTGMELVEHQKTKKGMYLCFSNGMMQYVAFANDGSSTITIIRDKNGQVFDAGDDATMLALDITGDGVNELLVGNSSGTVQALTLKSVDTVSTLGMVTAGGMPLQLQGSVTLSKTFGTGAALSSIVYADGNGISYRLDAALRGDITNDGKVDIMDLQQLGIHWGQRSADTGWSGAANLFVSTGSTDPQIINVLDLQILGNFWGLMK